MHKIKNLSTELSKRIRLIPVSGTFADISQSQGAVGMDGGDIVFCLSPEEPNIEEFYEHQYYADGQAVMLRSQSVFRIDRVDANGVQEEAFDGSSTASRGLAVSPDSAFLVDYTDDIKAEVPFTIKRNTQEGIAPFELSVSVDHNGETPVGVNAAAWSADSQLLAINSWNSSPNNYYIYKRQPDNSFIQVFKMKRETSVCMAFTPDNAQLVLAEMNYGGDLFHVVPYVFDVNANGELDAKAYAHVGEFLPSGNSSQISSDILWLEDKVAVMSRTSGLCAITIDPVAKTVTGKNLVSPAFEFEESLRSLLLLGGNTKLGFVTWVGDEYVLGVINFNAAELTVDLSSLNLSNVNPVSGDEGNVRVHPLNDMLISVNSNTQPSTLDWHLVNADNTATKIVPVAEESPTEFDATINIVPLNQADAVKLYYGQGFEPPPPNRKIYHDLPTGDGLGEVYFRTEPSTPISISPSDVFVPLDTEMEWPINGGYISSDLREFKRTENYQLIFSPAIIEAVRAIALTEPTRVVITEDWVDLNHGVDHSYTKTATAAELVDCIDNTAFLFHHSDPTHPVELTYTLDLGGPKPLVYKIKPTTIKTNRWAPDQLAVNADVTLAGLFAGVDGYGFIEFDVPNYITEVGDSGGGSAYHSVKADGTGELVTLGPRALVDGYVNSSGDGHLTIKANELLHIQYSLLTEADMDLSAKAAGIANLTCHYMKTAIPEHKLFHHRFFFSVQGF